MPRYSVVVNDTLLYLNQMRQNPKKFSKRLRNLKDDFQGNTLVRKEGVPIVTREGVSAVEEAIEILQAAEPQEALEFNEGLRRVAQELANRLASADVDDLGHQPTDELSLKKRARRYGKSKRPLAECIDLGSFSGLEVACKLSIDDGLSHRPHLRAILDGKFRQVGIASAPQDIFHSVTVVVLARGFRLKDEAPYLKPTKGYLEPMYEVSGWLDGAVKLTCEIRIRMKDDEVVSKKYLRTWEMEDGSIRSDEFTKDLESGRSQVSRYELFVANSCFFSQVARMLVNYRDSENVEVVKVDPNDKPQALLEANPSGGTPVLRIHKSKGGVYNLTDGLTIVRYLEEVLPGARLYPLNSVGAVNEFEKLALQFEHKKLLAAIGGPLENCLRGQDPEDAAKLRKGLELINRLLWGAEYLGKSVLSQDQLSMLDLELYPLIQRVMDLKHRGRDDIYGSDDFADLSRWYENMNEYEWVRAARAKEKLF